MKTAMKKLFSLILVAVLLIGVMPFQASASSTYYQVYCEAINDYVASGSLTPGESYDPAAFVPAGYTFSSAQLYWGVGGNGPIYAGNAYEVSDGDHFMIWVDAVPAHEHAYVGEITTAPTCTQEGVETFTCSCGEGTYTAPVAALNHNFEGGKCSRCGVCEDCGNVNCTCTASVDILVKVDNVDGYTNEGTFQMGAGAKSANAIYSAAGYNKNTVLSYCVTDVNGGNKAVFDETIELTAGGSYILWLEVAPAATTPEPTPAACEKCGAELLNGMCTGCYLDEGDCNCNETTEPESQKGKVKLVLDFNYRGAKDTVMYVERNAKLNSVIAGIPAPTRDGHLFSHWTLDAEGKRPIGRDDYIGKHGATIYAQWDDNLAIGGDLTVRVNLNYDRKMGDSVKNIAKGTKMGSVLDYVNTPYRWGYKFVGWYWDAKCKNDVEWHDEVLKDCEIFAKWERVHNETMLKIYINGDTHNVAKIVDLHDYAKDGWISKDEVKAVVKQYYTAKDSDGLTFYGLFDAENWKSFVRNKNHGGEKHIEVNAGSDTTVYVMVHNAKAYSSSSSTADASNPKTGDMIMTPVIVLGASAACLAALFYLNKKRAV